MIFLLVVAFLIVIALVWSLTQPLRKPISDSSGVSGAQLEAARDRILGQLDELEMERANNNIDPAVVSEEQGRLEFELAKLLKALEATIGASDKLAAKKAGKTTLAVVLALVIMAPLAAGLLYLLQTKSVFPAIAKLDREGPLADGLQQLPDTADGSGTVPPIVLQMVAKLEKRLQEQPNDSAGWAQLGRSYVVLHRLSDAVTAYSKAYQLAPDDMDIMSAYAWALYASNPKSASKDLVALYSKIYQRDPNHQDALWVLGLAAYNNNEPQKALTFWDRLLQLLPPGSPGEQGVRKVVAQVTAQLKGK